jgi:hypothetical protein
MVLLRITIYNRTEWFKISKRKLMIWQNKINFNVTNYNKPLLICNYISLYDYIRQDNLAKMTNENSVLDDNLKTTTSDLENKK